MRLLVGSLISTVAFTNGNSANTHAYTDYRVPEGPFTLHEHLFNNRVGSIFRVTDKDGYDYSLKVFSYGVEDTVDRKKTKLEAFANDRAVGQYVTNQICPELLAKSSGAPVVQCLDKHLQYVHGVDVDVVDEDGNKLDSVDRDIQNARGDMGTRRLDFKATILLPYFKAGRLGDLVARVPKYQTVAYRYPLYTTVLEQLVDSIKELHSIGVVHLGVDPSTVLCNNIDCEDIVITDFSKSSLRSESGSKMPQYSNELFQDSVRYVSLETLEDDQEKNNSVDESVVPLFKQYSVQDKTKYTWESSLSVDWFSVGATLFYVLAEIRYAPDLTTGSHNAQSMSEYIYKTLTDKLVNAEKNSQNAESLRKIRDLVSEGLLIIDGLLSADRSKRIMFDSFVKSGKSSTNNLRSAKTIMSALELEAGAKSNTQTASSCSSYLEMSVRDSSILHDLDVHEKSNLPSFLQSIC